MYHHILSAAAILLFSQTTFALPSSNLLNPRASSPQCWYGSAFPAESDWLSFDSLFTKWTPTFKAQGNTDDEIRTMKDAIRTYAGQAGGRADSTAAIATAMMVQESKGNTCTICGDNRESCGLLQVRGTSKECELGAHPCRTGAIQRQIECGIVGCAEAKGTNIKTCLQSQGGKYGAAARCYNTGSVTNPGDLRAAQWGDPRYVHIVANILLGADTAKLSDLSGAKCGFS